MVISFFCGCNEFENLGNNFSVVIGDTYITSQGILIKELTIKGEKNSYYCIVSNEKGETVSENIVNENDMIDGVQPVSISLGSAFYDFGNQKEFLLIILDDYSDGKEVYRNTFVYKGAKISIVDCSGPIWSYNNVYKKYDFRNCYIKVKNDGDIPAYFGEIGDIIVTISDIQYIPSICAYDNIEFKSGEKMKEPNWDSGEFEGSYDTDIPIGETRIFNLWSGKVTVSLNHGTQIMVIDILHNNRVLDSFSINVYAD